MTMIRRLRTMLVTVCLLLACLAATSLGAGLITQSGVSHADSASAASTIPPNSVTVNGAGKVNVAPDMATVDLRRSGHQARCQRCTGGGQSSDRGSDKEPARAPHP